MTLTRLQFEERLKQAAPGSTIVVYIPHATRRDSYTLKSVKGSYLYLAESDFPVHFDHVEELTTGGTTWKRR